MQRNVLMQWLASLDITISLGCKTWIKYIEDILCGTGKHFLFERVCKRGYHNISCF